MIRDPSDGSVREPKKRLIKDRPTEPWERLGSFRSTESGSVVDPTTSGLQTGSSKPENLARLEKSRDWLKDYFHRKTEGELK
jgi:hypothetical protein